MPEPVMKRLVISAPFGNYFSDPNATSTLGTFTRDFRAGRAKRWWRVLKTVRYYPGIKAWKNRLGLPNPGIDWLAGRVAAGRIDASGRIVSVSARNDADWLALLGACRYLVRPAWVELNVSCPNCPGERDDTDYAKVFRAAVEHFPGRAIVKLPPVGYYRHTAEALHAGVTGFHCCNTLPTPGGGLSGKPLRLLALEATRSVRVMADATGVTLDNLIGGGGVTGPADAAELIERGATSVAVGSVLFWPWKWRAVRRLAADLVVREC